MPPLPLRIRICSYENLVETVGLKFLFSSGIAVRS